MSLRRKIDRKDSRIKRLDMKSVAKKNQRLRTSLPSTRIERRSPSLSNPFCVSDVCQVGTAIAECDFEVTSGKEAMTLKGVGKSSGSKIDEYLTTGKIAKIEEARRSRE